MPEPTFTPQLDQDEYFFTEDSTQEESSLGEYADEGQTNSVPAVLKLGAAIYYLDIPDPNADPLPAVMRVDQVSEMTTNQEEDVDIEEEEEEEGGEQEIEEVTFPDEDEDEETDEEGDDE